MDVTEPERNEVEMKAWRQYAPGMKPPVTKSLPVASDLGGLLIIIVNNTYTIKHITSFSVGCSCLSFLFFFVFLFGVSDY